MQFHVVFLLVRENGGLLCCLDPDAIKNRVYQFFRRSLPDVLLSNPRRAQTRYSTKNKQSFRLIHNCCIREPRFYIQFSRISLICLEICFVSGEKVGDLVVNFFHGVFLDHFAAAR
ncbi:hypothetical protein AO946_09125 [Pseudomonas aeruginosa]|nr:hypothetical protein AO946_09125 [Pseudomonas aeruginosa]PBN23799.1 hypothetical protein B8B65_28655 [Pseudomonas aeruginosa]